MSPGLARGFFLFFVWINLETESNQKIRSTHTNSLTSRSNRDKTPAYELQEYHQPSYHSFCFRNCRLPACPQFLLWQLHRYYFSTRWYCSVECVFIQA